MRVLLVSANTERINMPTLPLGLAPVATATRQSGHEVAFLDLLTEADPRSAVEKAVRTFSPQVVGISARNVDGQNMHAPQFLLERVEDVVSACRASTSAPLVLGGPGKTKRSVQESLDFADSLGLEMLRTTIGLRTYPRTPLARQAVEEGMIAPDDDLLLPRFYLRPELETCIRELVASRGK